MNSLNDYKTEIINTKIMECYGITKGQFFTSCYDYQQHLYNNYLRMLELENMNKDNNTKTKRKVLNFFKKK